MGKNQDTDPQSYFRELRKKSQFLDKIHKFFDEDPDSGSGREKIWIRDKHHGSATPQINDLQVGPETDLMPIMKI
jgi:hypothetical protein